MKTVKFLGLTCVAVAALATAPQSASAHEYNTAESGHPFRLISYPFHALGRGLEYGFTRPVHNYVSQPCNRWWYGHTSHPATENNWGDYDQYQRRSY